MRFILIPIVLILAACEQRAALFESDQSVVKPTPTPPVALFATPQTPVLTKAGSDLIVEYEVGGVSSYNRHPYPEAPDARFSGITEGVGYDNRQNAPEIILVDWQGLGHPNAKRLSDTHPYYGRSAQSHLHEVSDILVPWMVAWDVFTGVDMAREFALCRRTFAGFDKLRPNAQAALVSIVFNRGNGMTGDSRREMRHIRDYGVPKQDYASIAQDIRNMKRLWKGTEISRGMDRRREAEAKLVETI